MAKRVSVPAETRRLTRAEASRLGVSYSSKRRVNKSVPKGKATKRNRLYTDREVAEARIRKKTGDKKATRESASIANIEHRTLKKSGSGVIEFKKQSKAQLIKNLKKYRDKYVILHFRGNTTGALYKGQDLGPTSWVSAHSRITARELLNPDHFKDYVEDSYVENITEYGLVVYL
jgi:hypothetical protein